MKQFVAQEEGTFNLAKASLETVKVKLNTDINQRNVIIRDALKNRLAVQLDLAIGVRAKVYRAAQDKMITHRSELIEKNKLVKNGTLRPQLSNIVAEMEESSLAVSTAKTQLSNEIKTVRASGVNISLNSGMDKKINESKIKLLSAQKTYAARYNIQRKETEYKAIIAKLNQAKKDLDTKATERKKTWAANLLILDAQLVSDITEAQRLTAAETKRQVDAAAAAVKKLSPAD